MFSVGCAMVAAAGAAMSLYFAIEATHQYRQEKERAEETIRRASRWT